MALAYVVAGVRLVFAICISMTARNGFALSVAAMVGVASVLPVVVAVMGSTVNMAAAMATAPTSLGGHHLGHHVTVQPGVHDRYDVINKVLINFKTNNYKKFYKNNEMGKAYSSSKIIFNKSVNNDLNMRFFEGICSGGLLVTDKIKNGVNDLFLNKFHYIRYNSAKDAIHKINYYLKNKKVRKLIADRGQKLAMKSHTYKHRLATILNLISQKKYENNFSAAPIKNLNNKNVSMQYAKVFFILTKPLKIAQLMFIYNFNIQIFFLFFKSVLKYLNSIIPMTPGAIRIKIYNVCKF
jgi:hypothetical protein